MTQWSQEAHARIAAAIKAARGKRSAQWLADRTAELGHPITRAQIANYESGRKQSLDIIELIVIAAALNTSPVLLVYPGPYYEAVELLPGANRAQFTAVQWFSAEEDHGIWRKIHPSAGFNEAADEERAAALSWLENTRHLRLWRELEDAENIRGALVERDDPDRDRQQIAFYDSQIKRLRDELGIGDA